jgi:hypothetical protein
MDRSLLEGDPHAILEECCFADGDWRIKGFCMMLRRVSLAVERIAAALPGRERGCSGSR